jgi:type IV pilus assembly protein PilC
MKGKSLHESLKTFSIYLSKLVQLINVGEETGQLDHFFARISERYIEEIEYKTSALSGMIKPLIIIFVGLIVGVILDSMYLPPTDSILKEKKMKNVTNTLQQISESGKKALNCTL